MSIDAVQRLGESPDLLHRFLDTPFMGEFLIANRRLRLRSNQEDCLRMLQQYAVEESDTAPDFEGKLFFDQDLPADISRPTFLENEVVVLLSLGRGCFVLVHRLRKEFFGFISAGIPPGMAAETVVPAIEELFVREATFI